MFLQGIKDNDVLDVDKVDAQALVVDTKNAWSFKKKDFSSNI